MRVAHVAEMYELMPYNGIEVWVKRFVEFLNSSGIPSRVYQYSDDIASYIPNAIKKIPNVRELFIYPYLRKKIIHDIDHNVDIIHYNSPMTAAWIEKCKPSVTSVHYLISRQSEFLSKYLPLKYKFIFNRISIDFLKSTERKGFFKTDFILVPREAYKEYLISAMSIPSERIFISKYGIDSRMFWPNPEKVEKENIALFVGRGSLAKGFDTLIEAANKINGKVVALTKQVSAQLMRKIKKLSNFEIRTNLSDADVVKLYQQALVFVLPSLTEGSSISTLEAMACGLPVVCTSEGGGDYIRDGENGYLFPFGDSIGLAEKVNYLFKYREVANRFGAINRKIVETEFSLPKISEKIIELYKQLVP